MSYVEICVFVAEKIFFSSETFYRIGAAAAATSVSPSIFNILHTFLDRDASISLRNLSISNKNKTGLSKILAQRIVPVQNKAKIEIFLKQSFKYS